MKTTLDISDPLLREARKIAARERTTLRALLNKALRQVVAEKRPKAVFRLRSRVSRGAGSTELAVECCRLACAFQLIRPDGGVPAHWAPSVCPYRRGLEVWRTLLRRGDRRRPAGQTLRRACLSVLVDGLRHDRGAVRAFSAQPVSSMPSCAVPQLTHTRRGRAVPPSLRIYRYNYYSAPDRKPPWASDDGAFAAFKNDYCQCQGE